MQSLNLTRDEAEFLVELIEAQLEHNDLAAQIRALFGMCSREQEEHKLRVDAYKAWRKKNV